MRILEGYTSPKLLVVSVLHLKKSFLFPNLASTMAQIASIILSIFLVSVAPSFAQFNQRAVLYDQYNGEGNYVVIPEDYISDLSTIGFNDKTASVCVTGM